jgi:hypothetical protein
VPHAVRSGWGVGVEQRWLVSLHVLVPAHTSPVAQFRVASLETQLKRHVLSQPSPDTVLRSSHSSPVSTRPLPQRTLTQLPVRHTRSSPQLVPSGRDGPGTQACVVSLQVPFATHRLSD